VHLGEREGNGRTRWLRAGLLLYALLLASCSIAGGTPAGSAIVPASEDVAGSLPVSTPGRATTIPDPTPAAGVDVGRPDFSGYRIVIARLGINLPIAEGDIPRDVDRAQTPDFYAFHLPGTSIFEAGNTYLYAHARVGMFLSLWNARVGDIVTVRTPGGTREYVIEEIHPRVPPLEVSWAGPTTDTRLTLQTSTGPNGNDPRFVVVARPR
jgi:hypothetical protein